MKQKYTIPKLPINTMSCFSINVTLGRVHSVYVFNFWNT